VTDTVADWTRLVHDLYPPAQAADWDNVGLQVGAGDWPVERVLVTLDVTSRVVGEAAEIPGTLVLAHHPLLFRPLQRLTPDSASGAIALEAARRGVAILAAHTNLDVTGDGAGTSDPVAEALDLVDVRPLTTETRDGRLKLVTFVPPDHTEAVLDALAAAGAGSIGDYERCSFRVRGTGTFRPGKDADPHSGTVGVDNAEDEDRLEVEVPRGAVGAVVRALQATHPYEEVAYDLYPTVDGAEVGFGRIGRLPQPLVLRSVAARIRDGLPAPHLRYAGNPDRLVRTVAVVGGSGDSLVGAALGAGADVFVTGDLKHHVVLDALEQGLALVDAGHHATESAALPRWVDRLQAAATDRGLGASLVRSAIPTAPWAG
jgi:dinuclear metal center YbgI/SA1388 family protein